MYERSVSISWILQLRKNAFSFRVVIQRCSEVFSAKRILINLRSNIAHKYLFSGRPPHSLALTTYCIQRLSQDLIFFLQLFQFSYKTRQYEHQWLQKQQCSKQQQREQKSEINWSLWVLRGPTQIIQGISWMQVKTARPDGFICAPYQGSCKC